MVELLGSLFTSAAELRLFVFTRPGADAILASEPPGLSLVHLAKHVVSSWAGTTGLTLDHFHALEDERPFRSHDIREVARFVLGPACYAGEPTVTVVAPDTGRSAVFPFRSGHKALVFAAQAARHWGQDQRDGTLVRYDLVLDGRRLDRQATLGQHGVGSGAQLELVEVIEQPAAAGRPAPSQGSAWQRCRTMIEAQEPRLERMGVTRLAAGSSALHYTDGDRVLTFQVPALESHLECFVAFPEHTDRPPDPRGTRYRLDLVMTLARDDIDASAFAVQGPDDQRRVIQRYLDFVEAERQGVLIRPFPLARRYAEYNRAEGQKLLAAFKARR